jgi:cardiolipin synthase
LGIGIELLWGSDRFWARAADDLARARRRLYVQAMTFEGDGVGRNVAAAIAASEAVDRRVLVDAYTCHVVSDRFVWSPAALTDPALRSEVRSTRAMFSHLKSVGVRVRMTNPVGPFFAHYPARNHKKLIVADSVAYIGGLNFSDHNFAWSDFMVRLEGEAAARFLAEDFEATFAGAPRPARADLGEIQMLSMDGRTNAQAFAEITHLIDVAKHEIAVVSPYLTFPFIRPLARARRRGVTVRLATPVANNKPVLRRYVLDQARRHGFEVRLASAMSHAKAIVVDREHLIVGSSNFDFVSVAAEEEIVAVISSRSLAATFLESVDANLADSRAQAPLAAQGGWTSMVLLRIAERFAILGRRAPRTAIDWP